MATRLHLRHLPTRRNLIAVHCVILVAAIVTSTRYAAARSPRISTYAGGAPPMTPVPALAASIGGPHAVLVDTNDNYYFSALNCVFRVDSNGVMTRVAGNSRAGYSGDNGPAINAELRDPHGLAFDRPGNLYIADTGNHRVRVVSPNGVIANFAGTGIAGGSGDGGIASLAQLSYPYSLSLDKVGNIFISTGTGVRRVSPDRIIATVAPGYGSIAADVSGNVFVSSGSEGAVRKVVVSRSTMRSDENNNGEAVASHLRGPAGLAFDHAGNLYIAEAPVGSVRRLSPAGLLTAFAGTGNPGYSGDGGPATQAQLLSPEGLAVDSRGSLYIADSGNGLRKISSDGVISTAAGNGTLNYSGDNGSSVQAQLSDPVSLAVTREGILYIADSGNARIRKVSPEGVITTFIVGDDSGSALDPEVLAVDSAGNLYFYDAATNRILKRTPAGPATPVVGSGAFGYAGDGGIAIAAAIGFVTGIAADSSGNIYFADSTSERIRRISAGGIITTIAGDGIPGSDGDGGPAIRAHLRGPAGIAVDKAGSVYVADSGNHRVRKVSREGTITTIAGTGAAGYSGDGYAAIRAEVSNPMGVGVDAAGSVYIADTGNNRIREISRSGIIRTLAGTGRFGYSGDGGPADHAQLGAAAIALDKAGNIFVADPENNAVRRIGVRRELLRRKPN